MMNKQRSKRKRRRRLVNDDQKRLAELVYYKAIREQTEKKITEKYLKRINYLVEANNELMKELEQYERVGMQERV